MDLQSCKVVGKVEVIQHISFIGKFQSEGGGDQQGFITVFLYNNIPCSDFWNFEVSWKNKGTFDTFFLLSAG